jgi:hypothetical protein
MLTDHVLNMVAQAACDQDHQYVALVATNCDIIINIIQLRTLIQIRTLNLMVGSPTGTPPADHEMAPSAAAYECARGVTPCSLVDDMAAPPVACNDRSAGPPPAAQS